MYDEICRAIRERRVITCTYDDRERKGEPHLLGLSGEMFILTIELFQTGGERRESGDLPDWRHFVVAQIPDLIVTNKRFTRRPTFNPNPRPNPWRGVICSV